MILLTEYIIEHRDPILVPKCKKRGGNRNDLHFSIQANPSE